MAFIVSLISLLTRINFGKNDSENPCAFFGLFAFPLSICLSYLIPKKDTFSDKIYSLFLTILVIAPVLFTFLSIEDHYLKEHLNQNGIVVKTTFTSSSTYTRGETFYFAYELNHQTYHHSISYRGSNYAVGDTIELWVSQETPDIYEIVRIYK